MRPSLPLRTQIVIAMSIRRARSAPATRLETGKIASQNATLRDIRATWRRADSTRPRSPSSRIRGRARGHPTLPTSMNPPTLNPDLMSVARDAVFWRWCARSRSLRIPQRATQHFAHHRLGQLGAKFDMRRHFVPRELLPAECSELVLGRGLSGPHDDPGLDDFALERIGHARRS